MKEELLYENPMKNKEDLKSFILEGRADLSFDGNSMTVKNTLDDRMGQKANYVLWCPREFPSDIRIEWEFMPVTNRGLCMLFFAAKGLHGEDLFDPALHRRNGEYVQYHSGDINTIHVSYFRRKEPDERAFHTCNLRKSKGFYLVAQGADPIPDAEDADEFYRITVEKKENMVTFSVNDLCVFTYRDDQKMHGPLLGGGKIGFRQLAPLTAKYKNLRVYRLS